jgi:threonine dehydratase
MIGNMVFELTLPAIENAAELIAPYVKQTPLERSRTLSERFGCEVFVKYELFQRTGSFKVRGAFNKMLRMTEAERAAGVVAVSGGNHAQAVAYTAAELGIDAVILMAENTPQLYLNATRGYGATVELQPTIGEAFERVRHYTDAGRVFVHPFDDPEIAAGSGTMGLEILRDVPDATDVVLSIGGGGMATGVSAAVKAVSPRTRIWGVETVGADAMSQALAAGEPVTLPAITSIAKTLGAPYVSESTLEYVRRNFESVTVVPDSEAVREMVFIAERLKVITEPAAACTLAAAERLRENFTPESRIVFIFCGGNLGVADLCSYL